MNISSIQKQKSNKNSYMIYKIKKDFKIQIIKNLQTNTQTHYFKSLY